MRWFGILGILAYRVFVRPFVRRRCLYDESCSTHAIRLLRAQGLWRAMPKIQSRLRSCRMPAGACFVVGDDGRARLLSAVGHGDVPPSGRALEILAGQAEALARPRTQVGR